MERIVNFEPAYDRRDPDPNKNYGIHGVNIRFVLRGKLGAVQFLIFTNWQLPNVTKEFLNNHPNHFPSNVRSLYLPMAADLGYHSPTPRYEDQTESYDCDWLEGGKCYYDGSGLNAEPVFDVLLKEGDAGVWRELEEYYTQIFGSLE